MSFYRQLLRWAALPVTDRRWAAPLAAIALGFGLFVGVALGPGTSGSFATNVAQIIEEEEPVAEEGGGEASESADELESAESGGGFEEEESLTEESFEEPGYEEAGFFAEAEPEESAPLAEPTSTAPTEPKDEAAPAEPEAETVSGTVVQTNPAAGSYSLVEAGGTLVAVHAAKLPQPGTEVSVPALVLANGTLVEEGKRKVTGKATGASFNGTVSYVDADPAAPAYTVSKRGVSVLVRVHPDPAGALPTLPVLGAYATVDVAIEKHAPGAPPVPEPAPTEQAPAPGCAVDPASPLLPVPQPGAVLWQRQLDADGAPFTFSDFAGIVTAVCPSEGKLLISADESRAAGADVVFTVGKGIETKKLEVGESVVATATIETDGTLLLTGLASDEQAKGAGDAKATQGDLVNHNEE